jgi:hypothetical protein
MNSIGLEPITLDLKGQCSTNWANQKKNNNKIVLKRTTKNLLKIQYKNIKKNKT